MTTIILDDLEEEVSEEKLEAAMRWFEEPWVKELTSTVYQGRYHGRSLLDIIKGDKNGNDK